MNHAPCVTKNNKNKSCTINHIDCGTRIFEAAKALDALMSGGYGIDDLARMTGLDKERIESFVRGAPLDMRSLFALAFVLHVSTDWIVGLSDTVSCVKVHKGAADGTLNRMSDDDRKRWAMSAELLSVYKNARRHALSINHKLDPRMK